MKSSGVTQFLLDHAEVFPVSFHMPGHKGSRLYQQYGYGDLIRKFLDCDITEIVGADNLFQTEGIIGETADKYRALYGVRRSYLLVNGTSGGLIAAILATVPQGKKLIMARNCHKSVFNALQLGRIEPVYAYPSVVEEYGVSGWIEPEEIERCLLEHQDAAAVILPSPNYYGICSDIEEIAHIVHRHGKILIVDQAHGAHLKFMPKQPAAAEDCGADIIVNSTHKTLASFTQSAVLNLNSERVSRYVLEDKLQAIQSTSPSYLLMASLDINADLIRQHGDRLFQQWQDHIDSFYIKASDLPGLRLMRLPRHMDTTKINMDMSSRGMDGSMLERMLLKENIFIELVTGDILMCMTGIGNVSGDFQRLYAALKKIGEDDAWLDGGNAPRESGRASLWMKRRPLHPLPERKRLMNLECCEGRICASSVIPYPPGIPFLCPGEQVGRAEIDYIRSLRARGEKVIGVNDRGEILIGD